MPLITDFWKSYVGIIYVSFIYRRRYEKNYAVKKKIKTNGDNNNKLKSMSFLDDWPYFPTGHSRFHIGKFILVSSCDVK